MNYEEILKVLKGGIYNVSDFAHGDFNAKELGLGECNKVYAEGGEGKGQEWIRIHHFADHNVFIQVTGFYSSYNGAEFEDEWDCCKQVFPKEKVITVYE